MCHEADRRNPSGAGGSLCGGPFRLDSCASDRSHHAVGFSQVAPVDAVNREYRKVHRMLGQNIFGKVGRLKARIQLRNGFSFEGCIKIGANLLEGKVEARQRYQIPAILRVSDRSLVPSPPARIMAARCGLRAGLAVERVVPLAGRNIAVSFGGGNSE